LWLFTTRSLGLSHRRQIRAEQAIVCHQLNARWRRNPSRTTATVIISKTRQKEGVANAKKQRQTEQKESRDLFNSAPSTIYFQLG
jgi:hypothetical protein